MIQYLIHFQGPLHAELTAANVEKLKIDVLLGTSLDVLNCGIARCKADLCGKLRTIVTARSLFHEQRTCIQSRQTQKKTYFRTQTEI